METPGFSARSEIIVHGNLKSETMVVTDIPLRVKGNINVNNSVYVGELEVDGNLEFINFLEAHGNVKCDGNLIAHGQMEVGGNLEVGGYIGKTEMLNNPFFELRIDGDLTCEAVEVDELYCHGEITGTVTAEKIYSNGVLESSLYEEDDQDFEEKLEFIGFKLGMFTLPA